MNELPPPVAVNDISDLLLNDIVCAERFQREIAVTVALSRGDRRGYHKAIKDW
jgi:hypothetical protein